jgi:hypothetical protein
MIMRKARELLCVGFSWKLRFHWLRPEEYQLNNACQVNLRLGITDNLPLMLHFWGTWFMVAVAAF